MINIENYLRLNLTDMILVLISTLLIVLITKKYFWDYVKVYFDKREQLIKNELDDAKAKKDEGLKYLNEAKEKLNKVQNQAKEIMDKVEAESKKEAEKIISSAKQEAEKVKLRAREEIEKERNDVALEIKEEISNVALMAAGKLLEKEVDDEISRKYINDFIEKVGDEKWRA